MILPQTVRNFLSEHIQSTDDIDVLMLLRGAPQKQWSALEVSEVLRIDPISAGNRLVALSLQGLVSHRDGAGRLYDFRYSAPKAIDKIAEELTTLYAQHRAEIHEYVARNQREQMNAMADAFRIKKRDP